MTDDEDDDENFTPEETKKIEELSAAREDLFSEIALIIASKLGYTATKIEDLANLSEEERISLEEETEQAVENWDDADMDGILEPSTPTDPLRALLSKHHELGEQICCIQDMAARRLLGDDDEEDDD